MLLESDFMAGEFISWESMINFLTWFLLGEFEGLKDRSFFFFLFRGVFGVVLYKWYNSEGDCSMGSSFSYSKFGGFKRFMFTELSKIKNMEGFFIVFCDNFLICLVIFKF